jgi:hypothetical protein
MDWDYSHELTPEIGFRVSKVSPTQRRPPEVHRHESFDSEYQDRLLRVRGVLSSLVLEAVIILGGGLCWVLGRLAQCWRKPGTH